MADIDDELEKLKAEAEALGIDTDDLETLSGDYGSPKPDKKDNIFRFFREVLKFPESWKVGNLLNSEIGQSRLTVRSYLEIARYAEQEGLDIVSQYFVDRADIVSSTSMGRKGFLAQLFVTQIKKEQKLKEPRKEKKGWFKKSEEEEENV